MELLKHTPGPWHIDTLDDEEKFDLPNGPIHQVLGTANGYPSTVCVIEHWQEVPDFDPPRLADARLIAAAPELLEALRVFVSCQYPVSTEIDDRGRRWVQAYLDDALLIAHAAIAKAEVA